MKESEHLQKLVELFEERADYHDGIVRGVQYDGLDVARAFIMGMRQAYSEASLEAIYAQATEGEEQPTPEGIEEAG